MEITIWCLHIMSHALVIESYVPEGVANFTESIYISEVTGGSQELTVLKAEISLTGKNWHIPMDVVLLETFALSGASFSSSRGSFQV